MIFEGLILGMIIGKMRGGQLKRLGYATLQLPLLLVISFVILLSTSILIQLGNTMVIQYRLPLYILSYVLMFIMLFFNLNRRSLWLILLGAIGNFAAIVLNQGSMPVDMGLLQRPGFENMLHSIQSGTLASYIPLEQAQGITVYLGKRLATPAFYPLVQVLSVGDLFISLGLMMYVQAVMSDRLHRRAGNMLRFDQRRSRRR